MTRGACESEQQFTLVLTGVSELTTELEDALFNAGCDDATISCRSGRVFLTFSRTAPSLKDAIVRAVYGVRKAGIGADVLRVDHFNLVTQSDIARRIGRTRQSIHQHITGTRGPGGFPGPICEITADAPLYSWCEVARWLWENNMIEEDVLRDAEEVDAINLALNLRQWRKTRPELTEEVIRTIGE